MKHTLLPVFTLFLTSAFGQISLVSDIRPGENQSFVKDFQIYNGDLIFAGEDNTIYHDLFTTDGTAEGTVKLVDLSAAASVFSYFSPVEMNGIIYFIGSGLGVGSELYRTDGTPEGTYLVKDIRSGSGDGLDDNKKLVTNGELLFFEGETDEFGRELWKSDGTEAGTVMVKDLLTGEGNSSPNELFVYEDDVYFSAIANENGETDGSEIWKSDGTTEGTIQLTDVVEEGAFYTDKNFIPYGDYLYFIVNSTEFGRELYRTDGTAEGTELFHEINPGANPGFHLIEFEVFNGELFMCASGPNQTNDLWKTNGTGEGTVFLKDFSEISDMTVYQDALYFYARVGLSGRENLWKTNGTAEGTVLVYEFDFDSNNNYSMYVFGNELMLVNYEDETGVELYTSDGTTEGTVLVSDLRPGEDDSKPRSLYEYNGTLYFTADADDEIGRELYSYKPALVSTVSVVNILCNDEETGSISVDISGGTPIYNLIWEDGSTATIRENLPAGDYAYTLTDADGTELTENFTLTQPDALALSAMITNAGGVFIADGTIDLIVTGGTPPYSYDWTDVSVNTEDLIDYPGGMDYSVVVTDDNGCEVMGSFFIDITSSVAEIENNDIPVYPNPTRESSVFEIGEVDKVELTDNKGRIRILSFETNGSATTVHFPTVAVGQYIVLLYKNDKIFAAKVQIL